MTKFDSEQPIGLKNSRVFMPLILTASIFLSILIVNLFINDAFSDAWLLNFILSIVGLCLLFWIALLVRGELYIPFIHIRNWSLRLKAKDYTARLPLIKKTEFSKLAYDLNSLSEVLQFFSDEFQDKVDTQTSKIKDQNDSLNILYEIATTINESKNMDELLSRFLDILVKLTSAHAGTVRLITDDEQLKMVASIGLSKNFIKEECLVPIDRCLCGNSFTSGKTGQNDSIEKCSKLSGTKLFNSLDPGIISVPIEYQGTAVGIYNLFIEKKHINIQNKDHEDLLITVGKHLGMAFEKFKLTREAEQHSVIKERTLLAHELHDSLAQTLAGLRFQVTIIEENLHENIPTTHQELLNLHESIDEAYTEVRALISHFRAPMDNKGLIPAINKLIEKFKANSSTMVFFQDEWQEQKLKSEHEYQIIRIIQESLNNIKKHSQAKTVRLMIKSHVSHNEVLIEDDGIGIKHNNMESSLGEHIGLSVMQERAKRMAGTLNIESETGEGTQILLSFPNYISSDKTVHFVHN
jgi:two-component system, NarL family, nitrate/nitrite sensor histidine kinase NarX